MREGVWKDGRISVSLATLGTQAAQLMVAGLELPSRAELPRFSGTLVRIGSECASLTGNAARRQLFVALTDGHRWTEFLDLDPAAAAVDQVMIVDNVTGIPVRIFAGPPTPQAQVPYDEVRSSSAVGGFGGAPALPDALERLNLADLPDPMKAVVKGAADVYRRQLRRIVLFRDAGVRLALTFAIPSAPGAATLLLNLEELGGAMTRGLSPEALRAAISWPEEGA